MYAHKRRAELEMDGNHTDPASAMLILTEVFTAGQ